MPTCWRRHVGSTMLVLSSKRIGVVCGMSANMSATCRPDNVCRVVWTLFPTQKTPTYPAKWRCKGGRRWCLSSPVDICALCPNDDDDEEEDNAAYPELYRHLLQIYVSSFNSLKLQILCMHELFVLYIWARIACKLDLLVSVG